MLELIQTIICDITGKQDVTYETDFLKDLSFNSFDIMNFFCAFE